MSAGLRWAVLRLPADRRHVLARVLAERRDLTAAEDPALADVFHEIAVLLAEITDDERDLLHHAEREMTPRGGVLELPGETP